MSERIELGLTEESQFQILLPTRVRDALIDQYPDHNSELDFAVMQNIIQLEKSEGADLLTIDFRRILRKRDQTKIHRLASTAGRTLVEAVNLVSHEQEDPKISVWIGSQPVAEGRLGMGATVQWPNVDDDTLNVLVTSRMRAVADNLGYLRGASRRHKDSSVYAQIDRRRGVTLETNPIGSCSIGTDGMIYEPSEECFEATAHNIYSRAQQLVCMAGAIAIAKAEDLLQQGE